MAKKKKVDYKVLVFVPDVDSAEMQQSVNTRLVRDAEDNLLYLIDTKSKGKKFKELFPGENKQSFSVDEIPQLQKRLQTLKNTKKNTDKKKNENWLNVDEEIYQIEIILEKYNETKGTFAIKMGNNKTVFYVRKPTGMYPLHWDINSNKCFAPTESQSKEAFLTYVKKHENLKVNPDRSLEKITATIAGILLFAMFIANGYMAYKQIGDVEADKKARIQQMYVCQSEAVEGLVNAQNRYNSYVDELIKSDEPILYGANTEEIK